MIETYLARVSEFNSQWRNKVKQTYRDLSGLWLSFRASSPLPLPTLGVFDLLNSWDTFSCQVPVFLLAQSSPEVCLLSATTLCVVYLTHPIQIKKPHCENFLKPLCLSPNLRRQHGFSPLLVLKLLGLASDSARLWVPWRAGSVLFPWRLWCPTHSLAPGR